MGDFERDLERKRRRTRRWLAIGVATAVMVVSYALIVFGLAASDDDSAFAGGLIGIGVGLVPGVFLALAALSDRVRPLRGSAVAVAVWLVVGLSVAVIDIPTGLVAGFGGGGAVALRREQEHLVNLRIAAVAVATTYTFVVQLVVPAVAILVGAVVPLVVVGLADTASERGTGAGPEPA